MMIVICVVRLYLNKKERNPRVIKPETNERNIWLMYLLGIIRYLVFIRYLYRTASQK